MITDISPTTHDDSNSDLRPCHECGMNTIKGMPGERDKSCCIKN